MWVCVHPEVCVVGAAERSFLLTTAGALIRSRETAKLCFYLPLPFPLFWGCLLAASQKAHVCDCQSVHVSIGQREPRYRVVEIGSPCQLYCLFLQLGLSKNLCCSGSSREPPFLHTVIHQQWAFKMTPTSRHFSCVTTEMAPPHVIIYNRCSSVPLWF